MDPLHISSPQVHACGFGSSTVQSLPARGQLGPWNSVFVAKLVNVMGSWVMCCPQGIGQALVDPTVGSLPLLWPSLLVLALARWWLGVRLVHHW